MEKNMPFRVNLLFFLILLLAMSGVVWAYFMPVELSVSARGYVSFTGPAEALGAPVTGTVREVLVPAAGSVAGGDAVLTLRPTDGGPEESGETAVQAPSPGVLVWQRELLRGDLVQYGERLAVIYPHEPIGVVAYVSDLELGRVAVGMPARITLDAYPHQEYGIVDGVVREIFLQGDFLPGREQRLVLLIEMEQIPDKIMPWPGMGAGVEIITGQTRLLQRLF